MTRRRVTITLGSREAAELASLVSRGWDEREVDHEEQGMPWPHKAVAARVVIKVMAAARGAL